MYFKFSVIMIPKKVPKIVPINPIVNPIRKNTFKIPILLKPNVLSMAISLVFSLQKLPNQK